MAERMAHMETRVQQADLLMVERMEQLTAAIASLIRGNDPNPNAGEYPRQGRPQ